MIDLITLDRNLSLLNLRRMIPYYIYITFSNFTIKYQNIVSDEICIGLKLQNRFVVSSELD